MGGGEERGGNKPGGVVFAFLFFIVTVLGRVPFAANRGKGGGKGEGRQTQEDRHPGDENGGGGGGCSCSIVCAVE